VKVGHTLGGHHRRKSGGVCSCHAFPSSLASCSKAASMRSNVTRDKDGRVAALQSWWRSKTGNNQLFVSSSPAASSPRRQRQSADRPGSRTRKRGRNARIARWKAPDHDSCTPTIEFFPTFTSTSRWKRKPPPRMMSEQVARLHSPESCAPARVYRHDKKNRVDAKPRQ